MEELRDKGTLCVEAYGCLLCERGQCRIRTRQGARFGFKFGGSRARKPCCVKRGGVGWLEIPIDLASLTICFVGMDSLLCWVFHIDNNAQIYKICRIFLGSRDLVMVSKIQAHGQSRMT